MPTQKEVENHLAQGHAIFRKWCKHCVFGRGVNDPHKRSMSEKQIPIISMDYCYMHETREERRIRKKEETEGSERQIGDMPILVIKDSKSKCIMAEVLTRKGTDEYSIERCYRMISQLGYDEMILKSDQEHSIMALKREVREKLRGTVRMEESPIGEHESNGEIENAVQRVQGQFRSQKHALEARYGIKIKGEMNIIPWMIRNGAAVVNRYQVGDDGRTPYRRLRGRDFNKEVAEFGEKIMYLKLESVGKEKSESRWSEGIFVGIKEETGEMMIGTKEGVERARTFRRFADEGDRWRKEDLEEMKGVPWELIPGGRQRKQRKPVEVSVREEKTGGEVERPVEGRKE